jgi:putative restriction endonuclease
VVDPHKYGGASMHRAPPIVRDLAALFVRPPGSITNKMMNLDGSRPNAGAHDWRFFVELATDPARFPHL